MKVEWSLGYLGCYLEIGCVEGRAIEKTNYSFPPKVDVNILPSEQKKRQTASTADNSP